MALNWSFKARLHNASDAMKKRYVSVCDVLRSFTGVKTSESWDKVRVYIGRKTYANMFFRGKSLCLTLALNPADFLETKYIFENVSNVARFAATPLLTRMSSDRQVKYLTELFGILFENEERSEVAATEVEIPYHTKEELVEMKLIKVYGGKKTAVAEEKVEEKKAVEPKRVVEEKPAATTATVAEKKVEVPKSQQQKPAEEPAIKVAAAVSRPPKAAAPKKVFVPDMPESNASTPKGTVNLGTIDAHFEAGSTVTARALKEKGLLSIRVNCLKILADGELTKPLTIVAHKFSAAALQKIEIAGGTATVPAKN